MTEPAYDPYRPPQVGMRGWKVGPLEVDALMRDLDVTPLPATLSVNPKPFDAVLTDLTVAALPMDFTIEPTIINVTLDAQITNLAAAPLAATVAVQNAPVQANLTTLSLDGLPADVAIAYKPTITGGSPTSVTTGTVVYLTGTNFVAGATVVVIGGVTATSVTVTSPTALNFVVPSIATSGGKDVVVTTTVGSSPATPGITYTVPAPTIASISPTTVRYGSVVTVTGTNFLDGQTTLTVDGQSCAVTVNSPTSLTFTVLGRSGSPWTNGVKAVVLTTPNGSVNSTVTYSFTGSTVTTAQTNAAIPTGAQGCWVTVIGGGGSGGGGWRKPVGSSWVTGGGGGGGGGVITRVFVPFIFLGSSYSTVIGAAGVANLNTTSASGGLSQFTSGSVGLYGYGGTGGGTSSTSAYAPNANGGQAIYQGITATAQTGGLGKGDGTGGQGGAGGGSAGSYHNSGGASADANQTVVATSGGVVGAGSSPAGPGGVGGNVRGQQGSAGSSYGGGGGGGATATGTSGIAVLGGNGGVGRVIVEWV